MKEHWFGMSGAGELIYLGKFSDVGGADNASTEFRSLLLFNEKALVELQRQISYLLRIYGGS